MSLGSVGGGRVDRVVPNVYLGPDARYGRVVFKDADGGAVFTWEGSHTEVMALAGALSALGQELRAARVAEILGADGPEGAADLPRRRR